MGETEPESGSRDRNLGDVGGTRTLWGTWFRHRHGFSVTISQCRGLQLMVHIYLVHCFINKGFTML